MKLAKVLGKGVSEYLNRALFGENREEAWEEYTERISGSTTLEPRYTQQTLNILQQVQEEVDLL